MKECCVCGKMLLTTLDEYGADYAPECRSCFLDPHKEITSSRTAEILKKIEHIDEEILDIESEIDDLQARMGYLATEYRQLRQELRDSEQPKKSNSVKLAGWKEVVGV